MIWQELLVIGIVLFLFVSLYFELIRAVFVFFISAIVLLLTGIIDTNEFMSGFANEQIAVVILLLVLSDVIQKTSALDVLFRSVFNLRLSYRAFIAKMGFLVGGASGFVNNTPLVAIMLPYVYNWAKRKNISPSKVLIPLSYATILGGTITLVGTSTNLVVNSFVVESGHESLDMFDFSMIGIPVTIIGILFLVLFAWRILPDRKDAISSFQEKTREYVTETTLSNDSILIGKTVEDAGLRKLQGLFLVEILRGEERIAPVSPKQTLLEGDILMFAGATNTILELLNNNNGLSLPKYSNLPGQEVSTIVESVISTNSDLIGKKVKDTNFRGKYDAAIIAVNRNGERISGKIGDVEIAAGDLLLLLTGKEFQNRSHDEQDFYVVSQIKQIHSINTWKVALLILGVISIFTLAAFSILSLFKGLLLLFFLIGSVQMVRFSEIKKIFDADLYLILVLALSLGKAVHKSGLDLRISNEIIQATDQLGGAFGTLVVIYIITNILAMLVTNKAAVAIMFPVALTAANTLHTDPTPFFLAIAFAGCAEFMTPYGYQTNLMVYGPGGYKFKDYFRAGWMLSLLVMLTATIILGWTYHLI